MLGFKLQTLQQQIYCYNVLTDNGIISEKVLRSIIFDSLT